MKQQDQHSSRQARILQLASCTAALCGCALAAGAQTIAAAAHAPYPAAHAHLVEPAGAPGSSSGSTAEQASAQASGSGISADLSRPHSSVADAANAPYTVGSGDLLSISVWKEKELSPTVTVRPDGKISMPLIGELAVTGMTPVQVAALLKARLQSIVLDPRVTVTVVEIHSRMVYITGEVGRPGAYPLNAPLDVLQLIAQAGGLTEFASRKKIRIVKADSTDKGIRFDYKSVLRSGDPSRNVPLAPGDTVVVP